MAEVEMDNVAAAGAAVEEAKDSSAVDGAVLKSGWLKMTWGTLEELRTKSQPTLRVWCDLYSDRLVAKKIKPEMLGDSNAEIRKVTVEKSPTGLDFSIKGGSEHKHPIIISRIFENGAAARTNQLRTGDMILQVDDKDLRGASHADAVSALKGSGDIVVLTVQFNAHLAARLHKDAPVDPNMDRTSSVRSTDSFYEKDMQPDADRLMDVLSVPLRLSAVSFFQLGTDERYKLGFEVRAHDGSTTYVLQTKTGEQAADWSQTIRKCVEDLEASIAAAMAKSDVPQQFSGKVNKMGWLSELDEDNHWQWTFVVVTDYDINYYDVAPATSEELLHPVRSYPLVETRLRPFDRDTELSNINRKSCFGVLLGDGDVSFVSVDQENDLRTWCLVIAQTVYQAVLAQRERTYPVAWNGQSAVLTINYEKGLSLALAAPSSEVQWQRPFQQVRTTRHDGNDLSIDFVDAGLEKLTLSLGARFAVFGLYNTMRARIASLQAAHATAAAH